MRFAAPIVVIAVGILWLLNVLKITPGVDWLWTGGLAVAGIFVLLVGGRTRRSLVVGWLLIATSICSLLRQLGYLPPDTELPIIVIVLGVLLGVAQLVRRREDGKPA